MRILIAEDDSTSRAMLAASPTKAGYEPVATADGGAAAWAEPQKPDAPPIAILNWMMPPMDGIDAARRARARPANHPPYILMLTGRSQSADIAAGLKRGPTITRSSYATARPTCPFAAPNQQIQADNAPAAGAIFTFTLAVANENDL